MAAVIAKISIDPTKLAKVQNLIAEAEVASGLLEDEPGDLAQAAKEGLDSALEKMREAGCADE